MIEALKFVKGAVGEGNYAHCAIEHGFIRTYNGSLSLISPIPLDIACNPIASDLLTAIDKAEGKVSLTLTPKGSLKFQDDKFKVIIKSSEKPVPSAMPQGEEVAINGELFLAGVKALFPIVTDIAVGQNAFSNTVLMTQTSLFATCNTILAEYWVDECKLKSPILLSKAILSELIRINEAPLKLNVSDNSVTFHYEGGRMLIGLLRKDKWQTIERLQSMLAFDGDLIELDDSFYKDVKRLKPFTDTLGRIYLNNGEMKTVIDNDDVASMTCDNKYVGIFNADLLILLQKLSKKVCFNGKYIYFQNDNMRGVLAGMRNDY